MTGLGADTRFVKTAIADEISTHGVVDVGLSRLRTYPDVVSAGNLLTKDGYPPYRLSGVLIPTNTLGSVHVLRRFLRS